MHTIKFFLGTILVQMITVTLVLISPLEDYSMVNILRLLIPLVFIALMASFWFNTLSRYFNKDSQEKMKMAFEKEKEKIHNEFAHEREKIKVDAEKEKIKIIEETQQTITNEATKTHAKANFKVGASVAGVVAVGGLFVLAQMVTAGLLALTTVGGALGGYYYRGRRLEKKRIEELEIIDAKVIEHK